MQFAIFWSSLLFGIFTIKKYVQFSLTSYGTLKNDRVIKTREIFNFLPVINSSATIWFSFLLLIISAIISSKSINTLFSSPRLYLLIFLEISWISFEYSMKALGSFKCVIPTFSLLSNKKWYFASYRSVKYR